MALTTPRTWVTGETVTAALLNTHVRDALVAVTARCQLHTTAATSFGVGVETAIAWGGGNLSAPAGMWSAATPSHVIFKVAGLYRFKWQVGSTGGTRTTRLVKNGTTDLALWSRGQQSGEWIASVSFAVNDFVDLYVKNVDAVGSMTLTDSMGPDGVTGWIVAELVL